MVHFKEINAYTSCCASVNYEGGIE